MSLGDINVTELRFYKDVYYKLQNLEHFPEILPQARDLLLLMFSETRTTTHGNKLPDILSIREYSLESLADFVHGRDKATTQEWEHYLSRRATGSPRELFNAKNDAIHWLKQSAPVKLADGAWLGHINKITTPFALRRTAKVVWQILSEELGDGDIDKNHVHVFRELLEEGGIQLPSSDSPDFIQPSQGLDIQHVWRAGVAQLLISLFPHEFFPEILGFNLHFELLTLDTLKASRELAEVKLNPYYFMLHATIDNADSGHTAMALHAVESYLDYIKATEGDTAAHVAWKRVQLGFIFSEHLPTVPNGNTNLPPDHTTSHQAEIEMELGRIFRSKAITAHKIHCGSRVRIGRRKLVEWLDPSCYASDNWQKDFLHDLSGCRSWIRRGASQESRLVQEISWGGKMFGAFTQSETQTVKRWIDSLADNTRGRYFSFTGQDTAKTYISYENREISVDYPVFAPMDALRIPDEPKSQMMAIFGDSGPSLDMTDSLDLSRLLPLWFVHPCLLECCICIPAKTTTKIACAIIRILRAQYGFNTEGPGVDGMDEARRSPVGLVELGLELARRSGNPEPGSVQQTLQSWPSKFALDMLHLSMRPIKNVYLLLGMLFAMTELQNLIASSRLLSTTSKDLLRLIIARERAALRFCRAEFETNIEACREFDQGYRIGRHEISLCFTPIELF